MLIFKIELAEFEEEEIDSYSRGHITIQGNSGIISSKLSKRNQSMMIFISICDLLNSIRVLLASPLKKYNFVGTGCSFQFFIIKTSSNKLILTSVKNEVIDELTEGELVEEIWREVKLFMLNYGNSLDEKEIVKNDLTLSLEEFKKHFNL